MKLSKLAGLKNITGQTPDLILTNDQVIPHKIMKYWAAQSIDGNALTDHLIEAGYNLNMEDLKSVINWYWAWQEGHFE